MESLHTAAQVLGVVLVVLGAWLALGLAGLLMSTGLVIAGASVAIEVGSRARETRGNGGE